MVCYFLLFLKLCFFFAFFFAFFYVSLNPSYAIGGIWPPFLYEPLNAFEIPFLNTLILLTSGATITIAHEAILGGFKKHAENALIFTLVLALIFTGFQYFEYKTSVFTIADSVFGSTFFMATGFHGFHVIIGTIFIFISFLRLIENHFTIEHHCGFEAAA